VLSLVSNYQLLAANSQQNSWELEAKSWQLPPGLTFQHWSEVTPYTSSCELAGSCVFGKQSPEVFCCSPAAKLPTTNHQQPTIIKFVES